MPNQPLVSVGIPTFERPEGLRNTLGYITGQSHKNLEIIISDNCSPGAETRSVAEEFMRQYPCIQYFRQKQNIGAMANYKFVLEKASGQFFMWAADDDEWGADFIETCLKNSVSGSSVMPGFMTHYRAKNLRINNKMPHLNSRSSACLNVKNFLNCMQSSLFYGLHDRERISFFLEDDFFDFYDCYLIVRIILNQGFETLPQHILYTAGIDNDEYVLKTFKPGKKMKLEYRPFLNALAALIMKSEKLKPLQKLNLIQNSITTVLKLFLMHETSFFSKLQILRSR